jgi:hypothetical protein
MIAKIMRPKLVPLALRVSQIRSTHSSLESTADLDAKLRQDVKLLGRTLGFFINKSDHETFNMVEDLQRLGKEVHHLK